MDIEGVIAGAPDLPVTALQDLHAARMLTRTHQVATIEHENVRIDTRVEIHETTEDGIVIEVIEAIGVIGVIGE